MREYQLNYRERMVVWVWERMGAAFGDRWNKPYGPVWDAKRERQRKRKPHLWPRLARTASLWANYLADLQVEAIERAVTKAEQRPDPPVLHDFIAMARNEDGDLERRSEPERQETEAERQQRHQHGNRALSNLRHILDDEAGTHAKSD